MFKITSKISEGLVKHQRKRKSEKHKRFDAILKHMLSTIDFSFFGERRRKTTTSAITTTEEWTQKWKMWDFWRLDGGWWEDVHNSERRGRYCGGNEDGERERGEGRLHVQFFSLKSISTPRNCSLGFLFFTSSAGEKSHVVKNAFF